MMEKPLIGVNIVWEGPTLGIVTGSSGSFEIALKLEDVKILMIFLIYFITEMVNVGTMAKIDPI